MTGTRVENTTETVEKGKERNEQKKREGESEKSEKSEERRETEAEAEREKETGATTRKFEDEEKRPNRQSLFSLQHKASR